MRPPPSALRPPRSVRRSRPQNASRPPLGVSAALIRGFSCLQLAFSALPPLPISALRPFRAPVVIPPTPHRLAGGRPTGRPWPVTPLARGPGGAPRTVSGTTE